MIGLFINLLADGTDLRLDHQFAEEDRAAGRVDSKVEERGGKVGELRQIV
jgi:hypothetical protein